MAQYKDFISENVAPPNTKHIAVYNKNGRRVGYIPLGNLEFPDAGEKQYSIGLLSDIHLKHYTATDDFQKALTYLGGTDVEFICIAGDLSSNGTPEELQIYKEHVEAYSPNKPVYTITGNHEANNYDNICDIFEEYTGCPLYYSFTRGDDVFIMAGCRGSWEGGLFTIEELQWLYETLEANRNKRCFVFHHVRPQDGCGNAFGIYNYDIWGGTEAQVFESLMHHYKNAHQFHGHSHLKFYLQYGVDTANIDHIFGGYSIHIPSLAVPRDGDITGPDSRQDIFADSEGYVVDVYENGIHLRGRDFVRDVELPIASYWLDTTIKPIEANTYVDTTGTIKTNN